MYVLSSPNFSIKGNACLLKRNDTGSADAMDMLCRYQVSGLPEIPAEQYAPPRSFMIGDIPVTPIDVWHLKMPVLEFPLESLPTLQMQTV